MGAGCRGSRARRASCASIKPRCGRRSHRRHISAPCSRRTRTRSSTPASSPSGLARAAEERGIEIFEHSPVRRIDTVGRRRGGRDRRRAHLRAQGRARDERVPLAAAPQHAHDRAGVRLRADDRAAVDRAARGDRLERPAGSERPGQPVPLLPPDRRRPHPVRRLRRRLSLRRARPRRVREPARVVREAREPLLHDVPAARGPDGSRIAGPVRSTRARGSARSTAAPARTRSRTRPVSPVSVSPRPASPAR